MVSINNGVSVISDRKVLLCHIVKMPGIYIGRLEQLNIKEEDHEDFE